MAPVVCCTCGSAILFIALSAEPCDEIAGLWSLHSLPLPRSGACPRAAPAPVRATNSALFFPDGKASQSWRKVRWCTVLARQGVVQSYGPSTFRTASDRGAYLRQDP